MIERLAVLLWFEFRKELQAPLAFFGRYLGIFLFMYSLHFVQKTSVWGSTVAFIPGQRMDFALFWVSGYALLMVMPHFLIVGGETVAFLAGTGLMEWLSLSPVAPREFFLARLLWRSLTALLDLAAVAVFGRLVFGVRVLTLAEGPVLLAALMMGLCYAGIGMAVSAAALLGRAGESTRMAVDRASGLFGGVFFPIHMLPKAVYGLARVLPIAAALEVLRRGLRGLPWAGEPAWRVLCVTAVVCAIAGPLLLDAALRRARRLRRAQ